jgi:hypothetical protein
MLESCDRRWKVTSSIRLTPAWRIVLATSAGEEIV